MQVNVGKIDKIIRIIIGLLLLIIGVVFDNLLWIIGLLLLFSAYYSFCLLYKILNIATNDKKMMIVAVVVNAVNKD